MSCNPCCCLKLKDAAVTIGIWSTVYSLVQIGVFGWQFSVLAQCQHVIMAQSNLQCDYYCPCVGASTARTSAIIEASHTIVKCQFNRLFLSYQSDFDACIFIYYIYSIVQLGIFGWQMAAIKYEKDRAANTLLPNYNTFGRYDIPTYYESYWQSPEERYYTWLFVIQILCLISAFFLLFASIMMIYGVHTWSRYLLVPWMVTMCASILTSLAYCIMWWAGDVRDYWLMLTIIEMFGVFLNTYCFVVIIMFHRRMLAELEYYARRRKYDRFSQVPWETPQHTIEQELGDTDDERRETIGPPYRRPTASQFPYQQQPMPYQPQQPGTPAMPITPARFGQRTPVERFPQEPFSARPFVPMSETVPRDQQIRPHSALERRPPYDDFRDVPRQAERKASSYRQRNICRECAREQHRHCRHCRHCHYIVDQCHCHRHSGRRRKTSCSSICTISANGGEYSVDEMPKSQQKEQHRRSKRSRRKGRRKSRGGEQRHWSEDQDSDLSEFAQTAPSERDYGNLSSLERQRRERIAEQWRRYPSMERRRQSTQQREGTLQRNAAIQADGGELSRMDSMGTLPRALSQQHFAAPQGISIPQHIVIPPAGATPTDPQAERKYRINSEIVISYDPQRDESSRAQQQPPIVPPRRHLPGIWSPRSGYINMSAGGTPTTPRGPSTTPQIASRRSGGEQTKNEQQPISMTSNV